MLPNALLQSLQGVPGFNQDAFVQVHEVQTSVTSVRTNLSKAADTKYAFALDQPIPWCNNGFYLSNRPSFIFDPLWHGGAYYVQEASSMFLQEVLRQTIGEATTTKKVLDLCAAPGGKSTLLADFFADGLVVANEVIKSRVTILAENLTRWGSLNTLVSNNDPADFAQLNAFFDVIVADAPCSGSGLFRKDTAAIDEWSEANVQLCSQRQQRIIADVLPALKTNGLFIYSTCSYSAEEDEAICDWLMEQGGMENISLQLQDSWGIVPTASHKHKAVGYRFYPYQLKGEGFFIACFKKTADDDGYDQYVEVKSSVTNQEKEVLTHWVTDLEAVHLTKQKEMLIAWPKIFEADIKILQKNLGLRKAGVALGTLKGKDFIPHHALALSQLLHPNLTAIPLNEADAIAYLQKKVLNLDVAQKGWALAQYQNTNLGWMKLLPNRINNYYPAEWRILKDHI
jgi:16S rRNA C967 or C1407 C5-methylase (RsmB/RsmF family)/NOL1/NOP2/fmu family ribosome biogenesis protein